jgi:hypothetical protein
MNRFPLFLAVVLLAGPAFPAAAQDHRPTPPQRNDDEARPRDLQRLQDDLANLDDELAALPEPDARGGDLRRRADELREDVIYLKVKMRRAQRSGGAGTGVGYEEVADLRREVGALREDIARLTAPDERELRVPVGAEVMLRLEDPLSSRTARREDRFEASLLSPLRAGRAIAVPAGARARGVVRSVEPAERGTQGGRLELEFDSLWIGSERLPLRGRVVSIDDNTGSDRARKAGLGAVLGGVVGGVLGGKKGAVIGVIVGGGGAVAASKGDEVELPEGTVLVLRLDRELIVPHP